MINMVIEILNGKLWKLNESDMVRSSIQKNSLSDLSCFKLLIQDQLFFFGVVDECLVELYSNDPEVCVKVTLTKSSQKDGTSVELAELVSIREVGKMVRWFTGIRKL